MRYTLTLLALLPLLATTLPGQRPARIKWSNLKRADSAPARYAGAMAYDSARSRAVLFGGYERTGQVPQQDTWEWNGSDWSQRFPANSPPARFAYGAMAYDVGRSRIVLFGGSTPVSQVRDDTWEYDGTNWTERLPATIPAGRMGQAMAYDGQHVVMFGGRDAAGNLTPGTWRWNGTDWTEVLNTGGPDLAWAAMAHDSTRNRVVLFGGRDASLALSDQTWEWDRLTSTWTPRVSQTQPPSARLYHAVAFDSARGCTVLLGGRDSASAVLRDTWEWDGLSWIDVTPSNWSKSPSPRTQHAMAFDIANGQTVTFGGGGAGVVHDDVWVYGR